MKKIISLLMVLVLCIACISAPAYAEDREKPEDNADINRNSSLSCSGNYEGSFFNDKATFTIDVDGYVTLNNLGNVIGFSCTNVSASGSSSYGSVTASANYTGYYTSGNKVYTTVYYLFTFNDGSSNAPYTATGSKTILVY